MSASSYDKEARRDTPLAIELKERIRRSGPVTVAQYMQACLHDPEHGYYRTKAAIGAKGDFITAPEISQVFGELVGLWSAVVWQQMGSPRHVNLVELGPGRGTLMRDALRAARVVPAFPAAAQVHLVESNAALEAIQRKALETLAPEARWHRAIVSAPVTVPVTAPVTAAGPDEAIPAGPTIVIANEFLDTLPVRQLVRHEDRWRERVIGVDGRDRLEFALRDQPHVHAGYPVGEGDIIEQAPFHEIALALQDLARNGPLAALFIDYGHAQTTTGDTLQAVQSHKAVSPLYAPGESDLTTQVDFASFCKACRACSPSVAGLEVDGPVTQAALLASLGIFERAARLMAANPAQALNIETGVARLMAVPGMGDRFKAAGVRSAGLPQLPGLVARRAG